MAKVSTAPHEHLGYFPTVAFGDVYANAPFTNDDNQSVAADVLVKRVAATYVDGVTQIGAFLDDGFTDNRLDSTIVSASGRVMSVYKLVISDSTGAILDTVYENVKIPSSPTTTTWADLGRLAKTATIPYRASYYNTEQTDQKLANIQSAPLANDVQAGRLRVVPAPDSLLDPAAIGVNSTRVAKDLSLYGGSLSNAISTIGSVTPTLLNITTPLKLTNTTLNLPANIKLNPLAIITLENSTLGVRSMEKVGNRQIFSVDSNSQVLFAKGAVSEINTAWWTGMVTDADISKALTDAIAACSANGGGVIYIPEGRWQKSGVHNIPACTTIYGAGSFTDNVANQGTTVKLTSSNGSCFRIGELTYSVTLSNMTLDGKGTTNSNGLLLQGAQPNTSGDLLVDNITFANFNVGINLNSTFQTWQFAQISIFHCKFTYCTTSGIRCDSINTAWKIDTCNFYVKTTNAVALDLVAIGATIIENCEFAMLGTTYASTKCVVVSGAHGIVEFDGCQSEGCNVFLENNASDIESIINFNSCIIQGKIQLNQSCTVNSSQGKYFAYTFQDAIGVGAEITSNGDRCRNIDVANVATNTPLIVDKNLVRLDKFVGGSKIKIQNNAQDGGNGAIYRVPLDVRSTELENGNPDRPLTSAGAYTNTSESKRLHREGRTTIDGKFDYFSDRLRDYATGHFQFVPNQQGFAAYDFFAPVMVNGLTIGLCQVESNTVVAASGITTSGNAKCVVTASGVNGGMAYTVTVPVTTVLHTTAALIAEAFEHALLADFNISSYFNVTRDGATLRLIRKVPAANDGTLNFTIENATCAGITNSTSSTLETTGSVGTRINNIIKGTLAIDPAAIGATTFSVQTFTLSGAVVGDSLELNPPTAGLTAGIIVGLPFVSATDTISIPFYNTTAGSINLASANWSYKLTRS